MPKQATADSMPAKQSGTHWQSSYPYLTAIGILYFVAQLFDETSVLTTEHVLLK